MATIRQVLNGLQVRLRTIPNLKVPKRVPETIDADTAVVRYAGTDFDTTISRGSDDQAYIIQVFTSKASDRGQDALYEYCDGSGERSVKVAVEADPTLDELVQYVVVSEVREPGIAEVADAPFYSAEILVVVSVAP